MRVLNYSILILIVAAFFNSSVFPQRSQDFSIEEIKVRIYDNQKDSIINEPSNPYGNDMDIFLSVKIKQTVNSEKSYTIKVEGFGKGRENDAEGRVEDHNIKAEKEIKIYSDMSLFVPFILDLPCAEETTYTVTLTEKGSNKKTVKDIKTKLGFCILY